MTPHRRSARLDQAGAQPGVGFVLGNAAFVLAMVGVGVWAAWPIYQDPYYLVTVGGAAVLGVAIAGIGALRSWSWSTVLLITVVSYLIAGVPLAVPSALSSVAAAGQGFVKLVAATALSWKELVTISIPVGSYQTMLVPVLILVLGVTTAALSLAWRARTLHVLAIPATALLQLFGLAFGSRTTSDPFQLGPVNLPAPRESLIGLAALLIAVGFLVWRAQFSRRTALRRSSRATGVRQSSAGWAGQLKRAALVAGTLVLATVIAVPLAATAVRPAERDVLRTGIDPAVALREYVSPLSQYRSYFTGPLYDTALFTVSEASSDITRLRMAVLSHYDGQIFRVVDPVGGVSDQTTAFARVPNARDSDAAGARASATITAGAYDGVWLPLAGPLTRIDFSGPRREALTDAFYYSARTDAGVELRPLRAGDSYTLETRVGETVAPLASLTPPADQADVIDAALIPDTLVAWVRAQRVSSDGAGLAELINRLRERGYLSHALDTPVPGTGWAGALTDYSFAPALAGHSTDRISSLFADLLEKQNSTTATDNAALVAAVGDDEQFAVAAALLAAQLGFPSRVVLGFTLGGADTGQQAIPACTDGVCAGKNLIAWVEVAGADGAWTPVAVTPQHENPLAPSDTQQRDPKIATQVLPADATEQAPPDANPASGDEKTNDDRTETADLGWLVGILKIAGIVALSLLVVVAPFLAILGAKVQRRRERKRGRTAGARIIGGWDEYVDTAVDHGRPSPGTLTRTEFAAQHGSAGGAMLAALADQAVFSPVEPDAADSDRFWALVESERSLFWRDAPRRIRLRAALSLRSFARALTTQETSGFDYSGFDSRRSRRSKRGNGGAPDPGRTHD